MNKEKKAQTAQYIEQQLKIENFNEKATKDLLRYYNTAKKATLRDINRSIKRNLNYPSRERLQRVYKDADKMINVLTDRLSKPIVSAVNEVGKFSYKDTNRIVSWDGLAPGFNNVSRSAGQLKAMVEDKKLGGKYLDDWLWSALREENYALKDEIASGLLRGKSYKSTMSELGSRYDNMLSAKGNKQNIETVTKSYIQAVNAKSHADIYDANSDIIKKVEWSAILENGNVKTGRGTCPRCMALDGMEFKSVTSGPPMPLHPRCRCMYLPITKTWAELGIDIEEADDLYEKWYIRSPSRKIMSRGTIDGNYADWWKTRSIAFQNNAVGPRRAEMIRSQTIDFQDIVDIKTGELINIADLDVTFYESPPITTYGYDYRDIPGSLGKILTISDDCDE